MYEDKTKVIAYYLPQFHPIPENDTWWGKGFTEWTNVGKASKLFKGHYQPRVPADLGYYDLRNPDILEQQAEMAREAGIDGFCFWHYWFGNGKKLLDGPINMILEKNTPNFPFCLAWANETWTGIWNNDHKRILQEQTYPGEHDIKDHFYNNLTAFKDPRYLKLDNRLIFVIYKPLKLPNTTEFIKIWNALASENGFEGFYFIGVSSNPTIESDQILNSGFDAVNSMRMLEAQISISKIKRFYTGISRKIFAGNLGLTKFKYVDIIKNWVNENDFSENIIPSILPNWDNSPRSGKKATIIHNSTPKLFEEHVIEMINVVKHKKNKVLFLKSWNEWAEGNYVEPDLVFGTQYLDALKKVLL